MKILQSTKTKMETHAQTLEAGSDRAQCYNIANYDLLDDQTIADKLFSEHRSQDGHLRAARLMVGAGCATEEISVAHPAIKRMVNEGRTTKEIKRNYFGDFTFEDGSTFN